jgi:hypothetical protein
MDDIYDFITKFTERLDEVEDLVRRTDTVSTGFHPKCPYNIFMDVDKPTSFLWYQVSKDQKILHYNPRKF